MNQNAVRLQTVALVIAAVLVPIVLATIGVAPLLCVGIVVLGLAAAAGLEVLGRAQRARTPWPPPAPAIVPVSRPAPPAPPSVTDLADVPLDSDTADYRFRFSATVSWEPVTSSPTDGHADPAALARAAVTNRAAVIARMHPPSDSVLAELQLAASLGTAEPNPGAHVRAWATEIRVRVDDQDAGRIASLANLRKNALVWEHERGHEREMRRYLGDDVLTSTGSAVVWWLARHTDRVEDAVALVGDLRHLSAVAQDRSAPSAPSDAGRPESATEEPAASTSAMGDDVGEGRSDAAGWANDLFEPSDTRRLLFARDLARLMDEYKLLDQGDQVREAAGVVDLSEATGDVDAMAPSIDDIEADQHISGESAADDESEKT